MPPRRCWGMLARRLGSAGRGLAWRGGVSLFTRLTGCIALRPLRDSPRASGAKREEGHPTPPHESPPRVHAPPASAGKSFKGTRGGRVAEAPGGRTVPVPQVGGSFVRVWRTGEPRGRERAVSPRSWFLCPAYEGQRNHGMGGEGSSRAEDAFLPTPWVRTPLSPLCGRKGVFSPLGGKKGVLGVPSLWSFRSEGSGFVGEGRVGLFAFCAAGAGRISERLQAIRPVRRA